MNPNEAFHSRFGVGQLPERTSVLTSALSSSTAGSKYLGHSCLRGTLRSISSGPLAVEGRPLVSTRRRKVL